MLEGLDPRTELVYRYALMAISPHCRGDRLFDLKTAALRALLRLDEDELAEILREAVLLEDSLIADLGAR